MNYSRLHVNKTQVVINMYVMITNNLRNMSSASPVISFSIQTDCLCAILSVTVVTKHYNFQPYSSNYNRCRKTQDSIHWWISVGFLEGDLVPNTWSGAKLLDANFHPPVLSRWMRSGQQIVHNRIKYGWLTDNYVAIFLIWKESVWWIII